MSRRGQRGFPRLAQGRLAFPRVAGNWVFRQEAAVHVVSSVVARPGAFTGVPRCHTVWDSVVEAWQDLWMQETARTR